MVRLLQSPDSANSNGMIKDRYGTPLPTENSITVFDTNLNYDSELFEDTYGRKLETFDRKVFASAYEVDVGAGADWPVIAYEIVEKLIPFSAVAAALFYGERIERSALAWRRMADYLVSCIPNFGFTDANGAALLALEKVFEHAGSADVKLIGYTWIDEQVKLLDKPDRANAVFEIAAKLDRISPRDQQFGVGLHSPPTFLFKFDSQGEVIMAKVHRMKVELIKL